MRLDLNKFNSSLNSITNIIHEPQISTGGLLARCLEIMQRDCSVGEKEHVETPLTLSKVEKLIKNKQTD